MIRVFRGAAFAEGSPDVTAIVHVVLREAPTWETVEQRVTLAGLNLAASWTSEDCMKLTQSISPAAYDALRAVPSDPTPVEPPPVGP